MSDKSSGSGIGCGTVLFLIFLTLKLAEVGVVKDWSWWWVFAPIWIPVALVVLAFVVLFVGKLIVELLK